MSRDATAAWSGSLGGALSALIDHRGKTPKKLGGDWVVDGIPVYSAMHVKDGRLRTGAARCVSPEMYERWMPVKLQMGDVFLTSEAPLGEVAYLSSSERACLGQRLFGLRANADILDSRFLFYLLQHSSVRHQLLARASGTTVSGIRQAELVEVRLHLPDLDTQRGVASVLSAHDDLIDNNVRRIQILEEMAKAIYREWFVEFRFPGHEHVALAESDVGLVPVGWTVARLADYVTTQYGYTESTSVEQVGPKFLRGMDMNKTSYIDWSQVPYCLISDGDLEKYRLSRGDILIIRMADPGKIGIVEADVEAVFASYLVRVRPLEAVPVRLYFLFHYLMSDRYQAYVTGASTGTTRKSVSAKVMTDVRVALPPTGLQDEFEDRVGPMRELIGNLLDANANLRATRDFLLPRLISGELDVSDLDIDTSGLVV